MNKFERDELEQIQRLAESGHTEHCASRQVWGDGACECPGDGTGSPHHTMNPPPGGWPEREPVKVPFDASEALRKLRTHAGITMGDAARALGLTTPQFSALQTGRDRTLDWRAAPTPAQVVAHAGAHGSGMVPVTPEAGDDWRDAPKVAVGLWFIRKRQPQRGRKFRAHYGYVDPADRPSVYPLGAWDDRVWFGVRILTNDLMETRWMADCECRPIDWDGCAAPWPEESADSPES